MLVVRVWRRGVGGGAMVRVKGLRGERCVCVCARGRRGLEGESKRDRERNVGGWVAGLLHC